MLKGLRLFRSKTTCLNVRLIGIDNAPLYEGPIAGMLIPERVVLSLSVEFFGDPEPCHIHRGAVLSRVFSELHQASEGADSVTVASLPEKTRAYLDAYPGVDRIWFYHAERT